MSRNIIKHLLLKIERGTLTMNDVSDFGQYVEISDVIELFDMVEKETIGFFPVKIYSSVYNEAVVNKLCSLKGAGYVNSIFAAMWNAESIDNSNEDLLLAFMVNPIIYSDLISRIRKGYKMLDYDVLKLDSQIDSFIRYINLDKNKTSLFFKAELTCEKIIKISHSQMLIGKREEAVDVIARFNLTKSDFEFLSDKDLLIFNRSNIYKMEPFFAINDNPNRNKDRKETNVEYCSSKLKQLFGFIVNSFNRRKKLKCGIKLKSLRKNNPSAKSMDFKITILLFSCVILVGIGIIAVTKAKTKKNEGLYITEKIVKMDKILDLGNIK